MTDTTTAAPKRPKLETTIDLENETVTIGGVIRALADVPKSGHVALALDGLRYRLVTGKADAWDRLIKGERVGRKAVAEKRLDPWCEAAAVVHAEKQVRAQGIKAPPGKTIRATAEFKVALDSAKQAAAKWDRKQRAEAKAHPDVVAEHARVTGVGADLGSLFGAAPVAADPIKLAAD